MFMALSIPPSLVVWGIAARKNNHLSLLESCVNQDGKPAHDAIAEMCKHPQFISKRLEPTWLRSIYLSFSMALTHERTRVTARAYVNSVMHIIHAQTMVKI